MYSIGWILEGLKILQQSSESCTKFLGQAYLVLWQDLVVTENYTSLNFFTQIWFSDLSERADLKYA